MRFLALPLAWLVASLYLLPACNKPPGVAHEDGDSLESPPGGTEVSLSLQSASYETLSEAVALAQGEGTDALLSRYAVEFESALGFDPSEALNYDLIQQSNLALSEAEDALYRQNGFVISRDRAYSTFAYGYASIYSEDLPVYISADSILDTVHRSFDDILKDLELEVIIPELAGYLEGTRATLVSADLSPQLVADLGLFLGVAQSLLQGTAVPSATQAELDAIVSQAVAATGAKSFELFGVDRAVDFSQFKPRGHYTESDTLEQYFRAMMWLGRIDFRLIETQGSGEQVFHRRQLEAVVALDALMDDALRARWEKIDRVVTAFIGEHDYMTITDVGTYRAQLGIDTLAALDAHSDDELAQAIIDGQYGEQRIASHLVSKAGGWDKPLPLSASFALFGQRYALDSHVFSQVVFDRVASRVVPNPLDVAFAALGNNQAAQLLEPELRQFPFAQNLGTMRALADGHPKSSWESSLYTLWLSSLRDLSAGSAPAGALSEDAAAGLPSVTKSEAWGRRLLNTQLGSWAQLRHDTLLYVKQSYTVGSVCEFPDAYVDPYPAFWGSLQRYAERGAELLAGLDIEGSAVATNATAYFGHLRETMGMLEGMANQQLTGMPHTEEQLAFVNDAVRISGGGSGPPEIAGWYHQLLYHAWEFGDVDNLVADVHTDPGGDNPPRGATVLHVGTWYPRNMVVAIETCAGPRAYVGPVFAFKRYLADGLTRLDDEEWRVLGAVEEVPDESWLQPIVAP